jgi:hypothetical protein
VSEDFDIALRLQIGGNVVRMASYHGRGFKEGVSLSIFDELDRWEKYAYGCNELVFNPMRTWLWKGPFTKLFRIFLFSNIPLSSKISICGYIFSCKCIIRCSFCFPSLHVQTTQSAPPCLLVS